MAGDRKKMLVRPGRPRKGETPACAGPNEAVGRIIAAANFSRTDRVLEVGCGDGALTFEIARQAGYVTGVAVSDELLIVAQDKGLRSGVDNVSFQRIKENRLPYENGVFDAAVTRGMLHRFEDPKEMLREMSRVLKSPGRIYVADTVGAEDNAMRQAHLKIEKASYGAPIAIFAPSDLLALLTTAPLEIVAQSQWDERLSFDRWMPVSGSSESQRDKVSRMLINAAKKKTTDLKIEISGKSITFVRRWMLITAEKTSNA